MCDAGSVKFCMSLLLPTVDILVVRPPPFLFYPTLKKRIIYILFDIYNSFPHYRLDHPACQTSRLYTNSFPDSFPKERSS